jgi:hypothetical protein
MADDLDVALADAIRRELAARQSGADALQEIAMSQIRQLRLDIEALRRHVLESGSSSAVMAPRPGDGNGTSTNHPSH